MELAPRRWAIPSLESTIRRRLAFGVDPATNAIVHVQRQRGPSWRATTCRVFAELISRIRLINTTALSFRLQETNNWLYSTYDSREKEGALSLTAVVYDVAGNVSTCIDSPLSRTTWLRPGHHHIEIPAAILIQNGCFFVDSGDERGGKATGDDRRRTGVASSVLSLVQRRLGIDQRRVRFRTSVATMGYPDGAHTFSAAFTDHAEQ